MPSRNRVPNAAELVSRSLNCTRAVSPCKRSDILNAPRNCSRLCTYSRPRYAPAYDEQIIARPRAEVQPQPLLWFPDDAMTEGRCGKSTRQKKSRRFRRLLKLITGRRQTEWTGATRCPNEDDQSHNRESLTDRKRTNFFSLHLPCRPLAYREGDLRLEKIVRRILGRALFRHRLSQPLDLRIQQRDALGQFLDRQQVQVLSDLVRDFLPRLVVVLACHGVLPWHPRLTVSLGPVASGGTAG